MSSTHRFSAGYHLVETYVEPAAGDHALMDHERHQRANRRIYATGVGVERLDLPLVAKLEGVHFPVFPDEAVATDTLELPESVLAETTVSDPPTLRGVWLASAELAGQLVRWFTTDTAPGDGGRGLALP
jgi:hypothetical protein